MTHITLEHAPDRREKRTRPPGIRRQRLLAVVAHNPGIHVRRAAHLLGLSWHATENHVRHLVAQGALASVKVQGKVCLYDVRGGRMRNKRAQALLHDPRNRVLVGRLLLDPGLPQATLASMTGLAASVVHRRLAALEDAGVLHRVPAGRSNQVFPTDQAKSLLQEAWA